MTSPMIKVRTYDADKIPKPEALSESKNIGRLMCFRLKETPHLHIWTSALRDEALHPSLRQQVHAKVLGTQLSKCAFFLDKRESSLMNANACNMEETTVRSWRISIDK